MNTELNERIAVEVMGYSYGSLPGVCVNKWWRRQADGYMDVRYQGLPDYADDMQCASLIFDELLCSKVYRVEIVYDNKLWRVALYGDLIGNGVYPVLPTAICHAALDICAKLRALPSGGE